jgi:hypothetical protein
MQLLSIMQKGECLVFKLKYTFSALFHHNYGGSAVCFRQPLVVIQFFKISHRLDLKTNPLFFALLF